MSQPTPQIDAVETLRQFNESLESAVNPLLPHLPPEQREWFELMLKLAKLYLFYTAETTKCLAAEAFFSANIMGAAVLETALLLRCMGEEAEVVKTVAWNELGKGKSLPFRKRLGHTDLSRLIRIGDELKWFRKDGVPQLFRQVMTEHMGKEVGDFFCDHVPTDGQISASKSHDVRNLIHPAKCIRENVELDHVSGLLATTYLVLAFSAFAEMTKQGTAMMESLRGSK